MPDHHSHTGFGSAGRAGDRPAAGSRCPRRSAARRGGLAQAPRWVRRGCSRSQAWAWRSAVAAGVGVVVVTCGGGQVSGWDRANATPCRGGRPPRPGRRGGAGRRSTRSERSRPSSSTGRSASRNASRVNVVAGVEARSGCPGRRRASCPAARSRPTTSRSWAAVTAVASSVWAEPHRVEHRSPRRAPGFQRGDERVRPARDHLRLTLAAAVGVAEQPLRAGRRVRAQPRAAHRRPARSARRPPAGQRQPGQRPAQPTGLDPALVERVIHRAVPAAVLGHQRQLHQRPHRAVGAQHRVGQLEQRIRPRGQTRVELPPEPDEITSPRRVSPWPRRQHLRHTDHRGHRLRLRALWKEPEEDQAVAVPCPGDTPTELDNLLDHSRAR